MTLLRRIHKRTRIRERFAAFPDRNVEHSVHEDGQTFRVEVLSGSGETIFVRELFGRVEIEERPDGELQIVCGPVRHLEQGEIDENDG